MQCLLRLGLQQLLWHNAEYVTKLLQQRPEGWLVCARRDKHFWWCHLYVAHLLAEVSELRSCLRPAATQAPLEHLQDKGSEHKVRAAMPAPRSDVWGKKASHPVTSVPTAVHSATHTQHRGHKRCQQPPACGICGPQSCHMSSAGTPPHPASGLQPSSVQPVLLKTHGAPERQLSQAIWPSKMCLGCHKQLLSITHQCGMHGQHFDYPPAQGVHQGA